MFDSFVKKTVRSAINTTTDTIIDNTIKPVVEKSVKDNLGIKDTKYEIPSIYSSFSKYQGNMISKPT